MQSEIKYLTIKCIIVGDDVYRIPAVIFKF